MKVHEGFSRRSIHEDELVGVEQSQAQFSQGFLEWRSLRSPSGLAAGWIFTRRPCGERNDLASRNSGPSRSLAR